MIKKGLNRKDKKRVFVTGGAHGIGESIVDMFSRKGYKVAFCDINRERGKEVSRFTKAVFHEVDVTDATRLEECMQGVIAEFGGLDILVNCVGVGLFKPLTEVTVEEFDKVMAINLRPVFITSRAFGRHKKETGNRTFGRIINISSTRYLQSEPGTEAYSASKGAIYSLTHALAMSMAEFGVTVNAIAPGWIHVREDEILRDEDHEFHPSGRVGSPEDIARLCLFLCEETSDFINGQTIVADGGATVKMQYPL